MQQLCVCDDASNKHLSKNTRLMLSLDPLQKRTNHAGSSPRFRQSFCGAISPLERSFWHLPLRRPLRRTQNASARLGVKTNKCGCGACIGVKSYVCRCAKWKNLLFKAERDIFHAESSKYGFGYPFPYDNSYCKHISDAQIPGKTGDQTPEAQSFPTTTCSNLVTFAGEVLFKGSRTRLQATELTCQYWDEPEVPHAEDEEAEKAHLVSKRTRQVLKHPKKTMIINGFNKNYSQKSVVTTAVTVCWGSSASWERLA